MIARRGWSLLPDIGIVHNGSVAKLAFGGKICKSTRKINHLRVSNFLFSVICDRAPGRGTRLPDERLSLNNLTKPVVELAASRPLAGRCGCVFHLHDFRSDGLLHMGLAQAKQADAIGRISLHTGLKAAAHFVHA